MKFSTKLALIASILLSTSVFAEGLKVAYVNPTQVLSKLPQTQLIFKKIGEDFKDRRDKLMAKNKKYQALQEKIQKESTTMSQAEQVKLKRQIESLVAELKLGDQAYKEDVEARKNRELMKLKSRIYETIQSIGKRDHYDFIFPTGSFVFAGENVKDISTDIIKAMTDPKAN